MEAMEDLLEEFVDADAVFIRNVPKQSGGPPNTGNAFAGLKDKVEGLEHEAEVVRPIAQLGNVGTNFLVRDAASSSSPSASSATAASTDGPRGTASSSCTMLARERTTTCSAVEHRLMNGLLSWTCQTV